MNSSICLYDFFDFDSKEPVNRIAYTDMDVKYKCKIIKKMQEIGMKVSIDEAGNICGLLTKGKSNKTIVLGSHTDSVPDGGQYDGSVGVIVGLKAIERIKKEKVKFNGKIKLIIYACEESSRFNIACIGSKYLNDKILKSSFYDIVDKDGIRLQYAIEDSKFFINKNSEKYNLDEINYAKKTLETGEADCAMEIHIEQYDSLFYEKFDVGVVTSIVAPLRYNINIQGEQGHSGTTPLESRKDAVIAGTLFVSKINKLSKKDTENFRVTIPKFQTKNWSANVIQNYVEMFLDVRMQYPNNYTIMETKIEKIMKSVEKRTGTKFTYSIVTKDNPVKLDDLYNETIINICKENKLKYKLMPSWAGHDLANVPAKNKVLLFLPSQNFSHNQNEKTEEVDIQNGINITYKFIKEFFNK